MPGLRRVQPPAAGTDPGDERHDEAALIAGAQRDPRSFAPLYAAYFDAVYRYCHRCLGDHEAAADATQEVFAKALAALPRYRAVAFRPWLFTIAHNTIADGQRRRGRRPEAPLAAAANRADPAPAPEEVALAAEARRSVRFYLAQLPADQRLVVELRLADLTGKEIATVLKRSLGSVKIAQHRAFRRLRDLMDIEASEVTGCDDVD